MNIAEVVAKMNVYLLNAADVCRKWLEPRLKSLEPSVSSRNSYVVMARLWSILQSSTVSANRVVLQGEPRVYIREGKSRLFGRDSR